ncbi:DUF4843 domain-containing protein [Longitalea luteola]|uniref:DUF4843 domain-containing protein n=1 Tax=Longitalea luteola TaxID=2812563 RepID=UPI001A95DD87|nr:DUF4843 domain-containing protein [Longitalea luteola]
MKHFYLITLLGCWLMSCKKDAVEVFGGTSYVYFANHPGDSSDVKPIEYSFAFHPGANKDTIPLLIKLIGRLSNDDRPVEVAVDASNTTALSGDYELPGPNALRARHAWDTIALVLHNSDRLKTGKFKLRLLLHETELFRLGPSGNRHIDITFSDMIARPAWWNQDMEQLFLGAYSDTKYRLFIEATGIADLTGVTGTERRAYAIIFRDFLARGRENGEVYVDENGQINVSPNLL